MNRVESSATTILLEIFSGFEYVSHSTNMDSKPNFWYISQTVNSGLILHVNKVPIIFPLFHIQAIPVELKSITFQRIMY